MGKGKSAAGLPPEKVQEIIALRRRGFGIREIGRQMKLHHSTVSHYVSLYQPGCVKGEAPPETPLNEAVDRMDVDGSVEVTKMERPASIDEIAKMCGVDMKVWIPQYFKPNLWQGFYKLKNYLPRPMIKKLVDMAKAGASLEEVLEVLESPQYGHHKVQLCQSKVVFKRIIEEELQAAILQFTREHVKPIEAPKRAMDVADREFMVCWGLWDVHLGLYAWQSEVGADFDVTIARNRILNSIDDMVDELKGYEIERFVIPCGNDFYHFDSVRNKTAFGDHFLDVDTRFAKVYLTGIECMSYMIEQARKMSNKVDVLYIQGNHDATASFTLCAALQQRFRNDRHVTVDLGANPRKYIKHGGVLLGFDHGLAKKNLAQIFSTEAHKDWSASTYREIQVGHTHQRAEDFGPSVVPTNGVTIRTNPALCSTDLWHHKQGLIGEPVKSVEAWRYDRTGYRGSHVAWARDHDHGK